MTDDCEPDSHRRYAIVGCGAKKAAGELPAKDKYTSAYFREKREFAEEKCEQWWILSAEHGLLWPDQAIDDYDTHIDDVDLDRWTRKVRLKLHACDAKWYACDEVVVLAGQTYIEPIADELEGLPCPVEYPFDGTEGIGEQRQWLNEETEPEDAGEQASLEGFA